MNNECWNKICESDLFVLDFSVFINNKNINELLKILNHLKSNGKKIAVAQEFYDNYAVIKQCSNQEQLMISESARTIMNDLKAQGLLGVISDFTSPQDSVVKLGKNPKVCFIFYLYSEMCESVVLFSSTVKARVLVSDDTGFFNYCDSEEKILAVCDKTVDPASMSSDYFATTFIAEPGSVVKTRDGQTMKLDALIGRGGEGSVYHVRDNDQYQGKYVVKIYHKGQLTMLRLKKLKLMEEKPIRYNGICWPEKMIYSAKGEPVGYLMPYLEGTPLDTVFSSAEDIKAAFPAWDRRHLIRLVIDILTKIQYLHMYGILVGDLRLKNIIVDKNGNANLVDIDSCQVGLYPCPAGFPDYTPPELQGYEFNKVLRTYKNESFACAIMMFRLLFCGIHPYDQKFGADSIEEDIFKLKFPYPESIHGDMSRIPWGGYDELWKRTPIPFRKFLISIFSENKRYGIQEMIIVLRNYQQFLAQNNSGELNRILFDV